MRTQNIINLRNYTFNGKIQYGKLNEEHLKEIEDYKDTIQRIADYEDVDLYFSSDVIKKKPYANIDIIKIVAKKTKRSLFEKLFNKGQAVDIYDPDFYSPILYKRSLLQTIEDVICWAQD